MKPTPRGFTLVELLLVVALIALLISMLLPALSMAKEQTRRSVCLSNVHQLHTASLFYANDNMRYLPYRSINHNWDAGGWGTVGAYDDRRVWLGYISGYSIENGSAILMCPSVLASPHPVANGSQPLGTWINQGWPVVAYGLTWYNSSYAYFANYKAAPVLGVKYSRTNVAGNVTLLNDMIRRDGWSQHTGNHSGTGGAIPHASSLMPSGANAVSLDGRARWVNFTGYDDVSSKNGMEKYVYGSPSAGQWWAKAVQ